MRATPATILAHDGRLFLPEDDPVFPLDDVVGELTRFTGVAGRDASDDTVDDLGYAAECLHELAPHGGVAPGGVPGFIPGGGSGGPGRRAAGGVVATRGGSGGDRRQRRRHGPTPTPPFSPR